jgi:hypothetical protein
MVQSLILLNVLIDYESEKRGKVCFAPILRWFYSGQPATMPVWIALRVYGGLKVRVAVALI